MPSGELRLEGVTRRLRTPQGRAFAALDDVSLAVRDGELLAVLGPSGAGKSTLLHAVAGLAPLTSGRISIAGRRIDGLPPDRRGFGMVFQSHALFPHLRVRENVGFGLRVRGVSPTEIARRAEHALRLVQLEGFDDKRPDQLSGGEQQRVAVARAIVFEPAVVLLDEPLSSLDPLLRGDLRALIRRVHAEVGSTVVFVTHDQDEALALGQRVAILRAGRLVQAGAPRDVFASPADVQTARFLGYGNILEGESEPCGDGRVVFRRGAVAFVGTVGGAAAVAFGDGAVAAIHPDDVAIGPDAAAGPAPGAPAPLAGRVESVEPAGRGWNVGLSLGDGVSLVARTRAALGVGEAVAVAVRPERVIVYPKNR